MNYSEKIFINLLSEYINKDNKKIDINDSIDWDQILNLAVIHNVSGIIYAALKNNDYKLPKGINDKLYKSFLTTAVVSAKRDAETDKIIKLLTDNGISHLMSKGYLIKNYYPNPELRTMGDIDILVKEEDLKKVTDIIKGNGYSISNVYYNEVGFDKNNLHFELHDQLNEKIGNGVDFGEYYKSKYKKAVLISGLTYRLTHEDHFIYTVVHAAKHFSKSGCGIRMIMDVAVFVNYFGTSLDWSYIWDEFDKICLKSFAVNIVNLCKIWFNTNTEGIIDDSEFRLKINSEFYDQLCEYILSAGLFGTYNRNSDFKILRNQHITDNKLSSRGKNILYWFFPNDEFMRIKFEWYREKPKYCLPAAWVYRWIDSLRTKKFNVFGKIFRVLSGGKKLDRHQNFMKKAGIDSTYDEN